MSLRSTCGRQTLAERAAPSVVIVAVVVTVEVAVTVGPVGEVAVAVVVVVVVVAAVVGYNTDKIRNMRIGPIILYE